LIPRSRLGSAAHVVRSRCAAMRGRGIEEKAVCGCACVGRRPPVQASDDFCTHSVQFASFTVNGGGRASDRVNAAADDRTDAHPQRGITHLHRQPDRHPQEHHGQQG
jgi:hypothetical protein